MHFSQLNNDAILEIFLHFVAIDWDGPFTLMLVCSKWVNLAISKPRVWTWIMVDETQAEWRERMEISAHLSKNLPLQIVLRVPFVSQVSLSHVTRRCHALFLDSKHLSDYHGFESDRSWSKDICSYKRFTQYGGVFKQINDSILNFMKGTSICNIQVRNEDPHYVSLAYSAWHSYERLNQGGSIRDILTSVGEVTITALVFGHSKTARLPRAHVLDTDLWGILPLLSNLCYLELADNYIRVQGGTTLTCIQLHTLQSLKIKSPTFSLPSFSLESVSLSILSLLDAMEASNLEDLSLHGPLHRIVAAMIKNCGRFPLLQLNISISFFDEMADQERLNSESVWKGLKRCTIDIPEVQKYRGSTHSEVVGALRLLFNLIPRHCSVQVHGDTILEPIMQSGLLMDVELHILKKLGDAEHVYMPLNSLRKIKSLSITGSYSQTLIRVPWMSFIEELWLGDNLALIYPNEASMPMRVLECVDTAVFQPEIDFINDIRRDSFSNLTNVQCDHNLALWIITNHDTPHLRSLTLLDYVGPSISFSEVLAVVKKASHRLLSLDTLGISVLPEWEYLLPFVANFNRSRGGGISTLKLDGLPHPAILYHLGRAFRGEADEPEISLGLFQYQESQMRKHYPSACDRCVMFGWSCYGKDHCNKWRSRKMAKITADMPLNEYEGDWGPNGQGWAEILSSPDQGGLDTDEWSVEAGGDALLEFGTSRDSNLGGF